MKRIFIIFSAVALATTAVAQETYENANLATEDLNGTARYVGMGGAMDALGADISTIGTNPAGIGLFRHSTANVSFGVVSQQDAQSFSGYDKTKMSFDQVGFVYSRRTGRSSFLNVAFNYHKSRNFNHILSAANTLGGASQNKLSYLKGAEGVYDNVQQGSDGRYYGVTDYGYGLETSSAFSQVDYLYYNTMLYAGTVENEDGEQVPSFMNTLASGYAFNRGNTGYIGEYDFNISGNINDRVYLGLTFGISDVHYKNYSVYGENLVDGSSINLVDERRITGTGFNVKGGVIFRPTETSPLRIGVSVATPTWYDLTTSNGTSLVYNTTTDGGKQLPTGESYDFKLYTPWKFGLSLGTTVGRNLAIGAVYEYADYGNLDSRINTGSGYDDWGYYYDNSESDISMNNHTEATLKGVHTLKLGLELKPEENWAIRLGYNFVSPMYDKDGFKDGSVESPGTYYSSTTDFTNWKSTNRITCGFGYSMDRFSVDLAYQYTVQNGDFYPFMGYYPDDSSSDSNIVTATKVDNKRHQVLLTLGYHF